MSIHGSDIDKVVIGVIESAYKGKTAGVKLGKNHGFFSYVCILNTENSPATLSSGNLVLTMESEWI